MATELKQARRAYVEALEGRRRVLKRQAEQDAFRREKRREGQGEGLRAF